MSNALITDDVIAKEALVQLENHLVMANLVYRDHETEFGDTKAGSTVRIRRPVQFTVRDGATAAIQDVEEGYTSLTVDKQKGIDFEFSSKDRTLTIDQFSERYVKPAMIQLANQVDTDLMNLYTSVSNWVGTPGTGFSAYSDFLVGPRRMDDLGVPQDAMRYGVMNTEDYYDLVGVLPSLEASQNKGLTALEKAKLGDLGGVSTYKTQNMKTHTLGSWNGAPGAVNGANQNVTYAASKNTWTQTLAINNLTGAATIKAGDVFTIANVYDVNPVTKDTYAHLKQFTVVADATMSSGAGTITISPPIITSGPWQTVSAVPATTAAVTPLGTGGTAYRQNLLFHRNAFALAMVPMELPEGAAQKSRMSDKGLSVRLVGDYNITTDVNIYRFDILYGVKAQDPRMAARLSGT